MKKIETGIEGLFIIEPRVFGDERGFFMETFNAKAFAELGLAAEFVQDNHSRSAKGVLRGLHLQDPHAQVKLVRVVVGAVWDVAVDLRPDSKTFGRHFGLELSAENKRALWIPQGFAHGFAVISDTADFVYKCSDFYAPAHEQGIRWDDRDLKIAWPLKNPTVSERDAKWGSFKDFCRASGRG